MAVGLEAIASTALFLAAIASCTYSLPARTARSTTESTSWATVIRASGVSDIVLPRSCPLDCQIVFAAHNWNVSGTECSCRCPRELPVFLHSKGQCVEKVESCNKQARFTTTTGADSDWTPAVSLPLYNGSVASQLHWKWPGMRNKTSANSCAIASVSYLNEAASLEAASPKMFDIRWRQQGARLIWRGSPTDARLLEGTIVQVMMSCGNGSDSACITFRVAGTLVIPTGEQSTLLEERSATRQGRFETILIILLCILLFLSVFGSVILWTICWRLKKSELISTLQMQFMYHMKKMEQEKALLEAERFAKEYGHTDTSAEKGVEDGSVEAERGRGSRNVVVKRKLFFSTEFLEPRFMANPPPMAEQFLHDLRKMIEIQRQRLSLRRHVPHLTSIPEEAAEHYRPYMEDRIKKDWPLHQMSPTISTSDLPLRTSKRIPSEESSPKSTKSTDSGNDSIGSSSGDTSSPPRDRASFAMPLTDGQPDAMRLRDARRDQCTPQTQSRIPISATGLTKSPKLQTRGLLTAAPVLRPDKISLSNGKPPLPSTPPPLPPRNTSTQILERTMKSENSTLPVPAVKTPAGSAAVVESPRQTPCAIRNARRKAYAVFPTDSMLKKSLPRRSKKRPMSETSATSSNVIETNM